MAVDTKIEWADHTANFWEGCTQVSPACDFCYAKERAERYGTVEWNGPPRRVKAGTFVVRAARRSAVETGAPQFLFVNSLSDFFDKLAPVNWRDDAMHEIVGAPECVFLLLTKRVGNVLGMISDLGVEWPENAWLGITVVNQEEADRDIPKLLEAKTALGIPRVFLSIEPMLGPIDLRAFLPFVHHHPDNDRHNPHLQTLVREAVRTMGYRQLDWVICGGESGKHARPMHPDWARSLRDQCAAAGVPFFFKQWGEFSTIDVREGVDHVDAWRSDMSVHRVDHGMRRAYMRRVGKARAGRLLDGVEHNGRPPS